MFLDVYEKRLIVVRESDKIKGIAVYHKVNDDILKKIENREIDLNNPIAMNSFLIQEGDNIHIFCVVADGMKTILKGLKEILLEDIKTVSWFSPDMKKFFIKRKESILCRQLS